MSLLSSSPRGVLPFLNLMHKRSPPPPPPPLLEFFPHPKHFLSLLYVPQFLPLPSPQLLSPPHHPSVNILPPRTIPFLQPHHYLRPPPHRHISLPPPQRLHYRRPLHTRRKVQCNACPLL